MLIERLKGADYSNCTDTTSMKSSNDYHPGLYTRQVRACLPRLVSWFGHITDNNNSIYFFSWKAMFLFEKFEQFGINKSTDKKTV